MSTITLKNVWDAPLEEIEAIIPKKFKQKSVATKYWQVALMYVQHGILVDPLMDKLQLYSIILRLEKNHISHEEQLFQAMKELLPVSSHSPPPLLNPSVSNPSVARSPVARSPVPKPSISKPSVSKPSVSKPSASKPSASNPSVPKPSTKEQHDEKMLKYIMAKKIFRDNENMSKYFNNYLKYFKNKYYAMGPSGKYLSPKLIFEQLKDGSIIDNFYSDFESMGNQDHDNMGDELGIKFDEDDNDYDKEEYISRVIYKKLYK